jgi:hypothetical protein
MMRAGEALTAGLAQMSPGVTHSIELIVPDA